MKDYYDHTPRIVLHRPIVIGGQPGCGARLIGRSLCARTGLPFVEVDRQIEHEAGRALAWIAKEEGLERLAGRARLVLERLAGQRPAAVIVLDQVWPAPAAASLLRRRVDMIHVARSASFLQRRLEKELGRPSNAWLDSAVPAATGVRDAAQGQTERAPLLSEARILLQARDEHEHVVAGLLLDSIESFAEAGAL